MGMAGRTCCIAGIGESVLGLVPHSTSLSLTTQAITRALADAGLSPHDIDGCLSKPLEALAVELSGEIRFHQLTEEVHLPVFVPRAS